MDNNNVKSFQLKKKQLIWNVKLNLDSITHLFCFLSVLFIGADIIGVNLGVNFRLVQLFLIVLTILLFVNKKYYVTFNLWIFLFLIISLLSTLFGINIRRGILYYCWIIYNTFFIFYAMSSYIKAYGLKKFIDIFRKTCYVQFGIFCLQYVLKVIVGFEFSFLPNYGYVFNIPRFKLWFYEPSYLATYLVFWLSISFYCFLIGKDKGCFKDITMCLIMLILSTSTTGFLGIAFVICGVYLLWLLKGLTLKKILFPFIVLLLLGIVYLVFKDIFDFFVGRLFTSSLDSASGGRVRGWTETYQVFLENPLFGVGPGNYGLYLGKNANYVPSNATLEMMATVGLFATIAFYALTIQLIWKAFKSYKKHDKESILLVACAVGLLIFTIILQANQNFLRLYHWMFLGVIYGAVPKSNRKAF